MSLLDEASLIVTPNGYKGGVTTGKLYSVKPTSGLGDMVVTRNTTSTRVNSAGLIQSVAFNAPRLDYPPLGGCPSILVEPQRKNEVTYSEQFDNLLGWSAVNAIVNANVAAAPDNNTTADKFIPTLVNSVHFLQQTPLASYAYTFSVFAKAGGETTFSMWLLGGNKKAEFNLTGVGSVISTTFDVTAKIDPYPNGWYRCSMYNALAGTDVRIYGRGGTSFAGDGTSGVFLWGAQAEATTALTATSYIPTTTIPITRNTDLFTLNNIYTNGLLSASGGTWFVDLRNNIPLTRDVGSVGLNLDVSLGNNGFAIRNNAAAQRLTISKYISNVRSDIYLTTTDTCKIAIKWNGTTADIFENGTKVVTATSFTPTAMQNINGISTDVSKNINQMSLWATPLTDPQCIDLTN